MPAKLALLICLAFVASLLMLDHRRSKAQSIAGWIPTIWLLYTGSRPLGLWFASNQGYRTIAEGSPMDRNFLLVLLIVGLVILARRRIDWRQAVMDNRWLFLLFLFMLISISWSDYPFVSFKRWIRASGIIAMSLVVLTGPSPLGTLESILRRTIYILIPFSALLVKYYPQLGMKWGRWSGASTWVGVTTGKNSLGILCMISALFLIWIWAKNRNQTEQQSSTNYETIANVVVLGLTFWLLRGPGGAFSATSVVTLIIGLSTLFILSRLKTYTHLEIMTYVLILATGLVLLLMWVFPSINPLSVIAELTGRDSNLTGRTDIIWGQLIPVAMQHPVLGTGYGGYWLEPLRIGPKLTVNQAHNGYIDIFLELGIVGLILFAIVIIAFFKKAIEVFKYDIDWGSLLYAFLFMSLIHNITESTYIKSTMLLWNILVLLMVAIPREGSMPRRVTN